MATRKVLGVMPLAVLVVLTMTSCGGGSSAGISGGLIPAAQAQTSPPPMQHWGTIAPSAGFVMVGQEAVSGQPVGHLTLPISMPSGSTITHVEGNISLRTACQTADALIIWNTGIVTAYHSILKATPQTPVNLPVSFDIPTPYGSSVSIVIGTGVSGCPSGSGTYYTNGGSGAPLADVEIHEMAQVQ